MDDAMFRLQWGFTISLTDALPYGARLIRTRPNSMITSAPLISSWAKTVSALRSVVFVVFVETSFGTRRTRMPA